MDTKIILLRDVPLDLHARLRIAAFERGVTLKALVLGVLEREFPLRVEVVDRSLVPGLVDAVIPGVEPWSGSLEGFEDAGADVFEVFSETAVVSPEPRPAPRPEPRRPGTRRPRTRMCEHRRPPDQFCSHCDA